MEEEVKNSKLQLRNFKVSKLVVLLNSLVTRWHRTLKVHCFSHLQAHYLDLDLKKKKLDKHCQFKTKQKILKAWLSHIRSLVRQREL